MDTIQELLEVHIARAGSVRRLAESAGLNHQTLNDLLAYVPGKSSLPSLTTIVKLSNAINTDPLVVCAVLLKGTRRNVTISDDDLLIAQQFKNLSEEYRVLFRDLARGAVLGKAHGGK